MHSILHRRMPQPRCLTASVPGAAAAWAPGLGEPAVRRRAIAATRLPVRRGPTGSCRQAAQHPRDPVARLVGRVDRLDALPVQPLSSVAQATPTSAIPTSPSSARSAVTRLGVGHLGELRGPRAAAAAPAVVEHRSRGRRSRSAPAPRLSAPAARSRRGCCRSPARAPGPARPPPRCPSASRLCRQGVPADRDEPHRVHVRRPPFVRLSAHSLLTTQSEGCLSRKARGIRKSVDRTVRCG